MTKEEQDYLVSKIGKILTWKTLAMIGINPGKHVPGRPPGVYKTCCQCSNRHMAKGFCSKHYMSNRRFERAKQEAYDKAQEPESQVQGTQLWQQ